jgi:hypothetical protein
MKKNEILSLLNPFDEKFNIGKEKEKNIKGRHINIKNFIRIEMIRLNFLIKLEMKLVKYYLKMNQEI